MKWYDKALVMACNIVVLAFVAAYDTGGNWVIDYFWFLRRVVHTIIPSL